jgi:hypothetical protein
LRPGGSDSGKRRADDRRAGRGQEIPSFHRRLPSCFRYAARSD